MKKHSTTSKPKAKKIKSYQFGFNIKCKYNIFIEKNNKKLSYLEPIINSSLQTTCYVVFITASPVNHKI